MSIFVSRNERLREEEYPQSETVPPRSRSQCCRFARHSPELGSCMCRCCRERMFRLNEIIAHSQLRVGYCRRTQVSLIRRVLAAEWPNRRRAFAHNSGNKMNTIDVAARPVEVCSGSDRRSNNDKEETQKVSSVPLVSSSIAAHALWP